jgi:hypothetical protein
LNIFQRLLGGDRNYHKHVADNDDDHENRHDDRCEDDGGDCVAARVAVLHDRLGSQSRQRSVVAIAEVSACGRVRKEREKLLGRLIEIAHTARQIIHLGLVRRGMEEDDDEREELLITIIIIDYDDCWAVNVKLSVVTHLSTFSSLVILVERLI